MRIATSLCAVVMLAACSGNKAASSGGSSTGSSSASSATSTSSSTASSSTGTSESSSSTGSSVSSSSSSASSTTGSSSSSGSSTGTSGSSGSSSGSTGGTVSRPSNNTGNGFFVLNGKVYDANGYEFRMRGVDRCHFDSNSAAGITRSGANAVRFFMYDIGVSGGPATSSFYDVALNQHIANKQMPIITAANVAGTHTGSSGDTSSADLATIVSWWVSNESVFAPIMDKISINIANEWGPSNSATWETAYESAITDLRNAGYTCPLVIDTGGSGQDDQDLLNYAQDVFNSDPQKNIIFSIHLYGGANDYSTGIQSVHQGTNTVVTLASNSATHPFAPNFDGTNNSYSGISAYSFSGVQGMTQLNGEQPAPQNVGGSQGAWTITLSVDSTSWPAYTGGGTVVDYNGNYQLRLARLAALGQSTGAAIIVGEFGPGRNIGPSPTLVTPDEIISASEANQLGWLAWAWDDNNLGGGQTNNAWFGMTYNGPGVYAVDSDLTMFGQQIVEGCINPAPGGCGCPDSPVPDDSVVAPGCQGTPAPEYSNYSLKLAQPATVY